MKNNMLCKILFAIELALLPLAVFAYLFLPGWSVGLFAIGVLLCKLWREMFRNRANKQETIMAAIASVASNTTLISIFMVMGLVSKAVGILAIVVISLKVMADFVMFNKYLPEFMDAVNYCFILFECMVFLAMTFAYYYSLILSIACIACVLTGVVYFGYAMITLIQTLKANKK